jgi:hypothetical protein
MTPRDYGVNNITNRAVYHSDCTPSPPPPTHNTHNNRNKPPFAYHMSHENMTTPPISPHVVNIFKSSPRPVVRIHSANSHDFETLRSNLRPINERNAYLNSLSSNEYYNNIGRNSLETNTNNNKGKLGRKISFSLPRNESDDVEVKKV